MELAYIVCVTYVVLILECSEEMKPQWFRKDEIPFDTMWPDDRYW